MVALSPADDAFVRLTCTGAPCAADALHLRSRARYNDGAPAASVTLAPLDGIVLARIPAVAPVIYLPLILSSGAQLNWTTDAANCRYNIYRGTRPDFTPGSDTAIAVDLPAGTGSTMTPALTSATRRWRITTSCVRSAATASPRRIRSEPATSISGWWQADSASTGRM